MWVHLWVASLNSLIVRFLISSSSGDCTDWVAPAGLPLPFNSSLSSFVRCCRGGQSMLGLRNLTMGRFLCTACSPVNLTSRAP